MTESAAPPVVIGIDAGGTHTRGVAVDAGGAVLARAASSGANPRTVGDEHGRAEIRQTVAQLRAAAPGPVAHLVLGSAGLLDAATPDEHAAWASELGIAHVTVDSDARIAHAAAFGTGPGVVVVAGTGSQCLAIGEGGRRVRVGGWGPAFGDEGSAYWIAASAIRSALRTLDAGRTSPLLRALLSFAVVPHDAGARSQHIQLLDHLYAPGAGPAAHATFAPEVAHLAERGDAEAAELLERAGVLLSEMAHSAAQRAGVHRVAVAGSVLDGSRLVREAFVAAIGRAGLEHVQRTLEPVFGAAWLAMTEAGWSPAAGAPAWSRDPTASAGA